MKLIFLTIFIYVPYLVFTQAEIEGKWTTEIGASTMSSFAKLSATNLRYISPKFRWSNDDLTEEQEKHADKYKKTRIMFELLFTPPFKNLCMGINVQYRLMRYKRISLEGYGGVKFFFIRGSDFEIKRPFVKGSSNGVWYINAGLIAQCNFGMLLPFVDLGYDGVLTLGTELNLHKIYKLPKGRYKLKKRRKLLNT